MELIGHIARHTEKHLIRAMCFEKMLDNILQSIEFSVVIGVLFFYFLGYRPPWWTKLVVKTSSECFRRCGIPGPYALPVLGTRWVYSKFGGYAFTKVHEFYRDMFAKYGPIIKEEALWNIPIISIVERKDIEKVLRFSGKYPIRPPTEAIAYYRKSRPDRYASTGIVNEQGEMWYSLRTTLTSDLTSTKTICSFQPQIESIADDWCNLLWQLRGKNGLIKHMENAASRLGLEAICTLVLGRRMGFLLPGNENKITNRLANAVHEHFLACRDTYYGLPLWKLFPTSTYKKLVNSEEEIYNLVLELIESADESTRESAVFQSVLNANIDSREKTAAIVDFIAAGIYTLRNSLLFVLHTIAEHPEMQINILNDPTNAYLKACVNETFRLLPTANCLARITETDMELSGRLIKAGSVVLCHTGLACRDERNFKNALSFSPNRWLGETKSETASTSTFLVVPFGVGRRTCPGKRFVEQVLPVILKHTVEEFKMKSLNPLELQFEFLLAPKAPISLILESRS